MADIGPTSTRLTELQHSWEKDPGSRVYLQLADEYRKHARHVEAIDVLKKGLGLRPNDLSGLVSLGRCHFELGELDAAAQALENVITRDPAHIVANKLLLEIYLQAGNAVKAGERLDLYKLLNETDPDLASLEAWLKGLRSGASAPPAAAPPAPPSAAPPAVVAPAAVPREIPPAPSSDPATFETLQAADIRQAMAPENQEEPPLMVAPQEEPLLSVSGEGFVPPLTVEEPMAAEGVFELDEAPEPMAEESVFEVVEEPLTAAPLTEEPIFDLEAEPTEVTLDEVPLAEPSPLLDEPAFELEASPVEPPEPVLDFEAPGAPSEEPMFDLEAPPSSEEPVFGLEAPPSSEEPVFGLEAPPSSEEPVFGLEAPPSSEEPVFGLEAPPPSEEPVFGLEASPSPEEPMFDLEASPSPEEPMFDLEASPPPEEPVFDLEVSPPLEEPELDLGTPLPPPAEEPELDLEAPLPPPAEEPVFDLEAPLPAPAEEPVFDLGAPPASSGEPGALETVEALALAPEPSPPAAPSFEDIFDLGPPPEPAPSVDDIFDLGLEAPLTGPSDGMLDDLWDMSGGAPEPEAGAAEALLPEIEPALSPLEALPEPEAAAAEPTPEPAPEEALEIAPELPAPELPEPPAEAAPAFAPAVEAEEQVVSAVEPEPAVAKVPADDSDSFTEPATATLGELYLKQGHVAEAEKIFRLVLRHDPKNPAALRGMEQLRWKIPGAVTAEKLLEGTGVGGRIPEGLTAKKVMVLGRYLQHLRKPTGGAHVR